MSKVYIIHLHTPLKHAQHYVGYSDHLSQRIEHHRNNTGARLLQVCNQQGIGWDVVVVFKGTRTDERRLKNQKHTARYCPICSTHPHKLAGITHYKTLKGSIP